MLQTAEETRKRMIEVFNHKRDEQFNNVSKLIDMRIHQCLDFAIDDKAYSVVVRRSDISMITEDLKKLGYAVTEGDEDHLRVISWKPFV